MRILGINCLNHDAAMAVVDDRDILWAAHAERYSKIKNDHNMLSRNGSKTSLPPLKRWES